MPRFGANPFFTGADDPTQVDVPFSTALGSNITSGLTGNPSVGAYIASDIRQAQFGRPATFNARFGTSTPATGPDSPTLTPELAKAHIDAEGLTGQLTVPKTGIPARALGELIYLKKQELRNQFLQNRYQGGVLGGAAMLGTDLAVAMTDPLNVAAGFLPVVGEARTARLLELAGTSLLKRGAVRVGVGAVEGATGQALLEPLYQSNKAAIQADYTTADSLRNVAFGGLFGATLHAGVGGVSDLLAKRLGLGAWKETIHEDGTRDLPDLPKDAIGGGGTVFVHGNDYVRGQFAVIDASAVKGGKAFDHVEPAQLGESPYAESGAPVLKPDGTVIDGSARLATVKDAYAKGAADDYRSGLIAEAEKYGLDSEQVKGMAQPVLVRVESSRDVGAWGEHVKAAQENLPAANEPTIEPAPEVGVSAVEHAKTLLKTLREQAGNGRLFDREVKAIKAELQSLYVALSEKPARPIREAAQARIEVLQAQLDQHALAMEAQGKLEALPPFVRELASQPTPEQHIAALRMGVAQAVNDLPVDVSAVRHLDGTNEGIAAFLAERKAADTAEAVRLAALNTQFDRAVKAGQAVDGQTAEAMATHVKELESSLREEMKATGVDPKTLDAVLAEDDADAAQAAEDAKAYNAIAMCLQRSA